MTLDPRIAAVTDRIIERSKPSRQRYLALVKDEGERGIDRPRLSCGNFAHGFAAAGEDKPAIRGMRAPNIGIVTAYNDMLSAHQPYGRYPEQMKIFAREVGATAQVAGGVPAMCDGVTQGQPGMDLSLFSRDTIALSTAVALSHGMFEAVAMLGICDKIVPGLLIGALRFGHLPALLIPAGPMPSGLANKEKQRVRQLFAEGKVGKEELLAAEAASYHGAGTCTFYGTANSNQMMMELMGLHIPGAAFINPGTPLRQALTRAAVHRLADLAATKARPLGHVVDERAIVNAAIGLLATGGSTNHAIHIPAIARAAGILIDWTDLDALSAAVPLIARVYPNGSGDVNDFHHAGGMAFVTRTLLDAGLLHGDILTAGADDFAAYRHRAARSTATRWRGARSATVANDDMLRPLANPFLHDGGMRLVAGNLGRAIFKTSAVAEDRWTIEAPCRDLLRPGCRARRVQGAASSTATSSSWSASRARAPTACPNCTSSPPRSACSRTRAIKVALVTDGRMSGASGKVPAAIHVSPEAYGGGPLGQLRDGDIVRLCAPRGSLEAVGVDLATREPAAPPPAPLGTGRELFAFMRHAAPTAEEGGSVMLGAMESSDMTIDDIMRLAPVIPVLVIEEGIDPVALAEALVAGGLPVIEVTLRTPSALAAMRAMAEVEGAIVGAGTVLDEAMLDHAIDAGARFIVSPGLTDPLARAAIAQRHPLPPRGRHCRRHHARARPRPDPLQILPRRSRWRPARAQGAGGPVRRHPLLPDRRHPRRHRRAVARPPLGAVRRRQLDPPRRASATWPRSPTRARAAAAASRPRLRSSP